ncbi:MAG: type III-A CRISPR-associated RAMP protein Csm3 [Promethearchaeota archaeon]
MSFKPFVKNIIIKGEIVLKTGLHIGGLKEAVEIGGIDNPVIVTFKEDRNNGLTKVPYIPGSAIKGKMRALLEFKYAKDILPKDGKKRTSLNYIKVGENLIAYDDTNPKSKLIPQVFGIPAKDPGTELSVSRAKFFDAMPTEDTFKMWAENVELIGGTEIKPENTIDRLTSRANPRYFERVPKGAKFEMEIVISIYQDDDENEIKELILEGLRLLKDNYLGGMGSRGYGKIEFTNLKLITRSSDYYVKNANETVNELSLV